MSPTLGGDPITCLSSENANTTYKTNLFPQIYNGFTQIPGVFHNESSLIWHTISKKQQYIFVVVVVVVVVVVDILHNPIHVNGD